MDLVGVGLTVCGITIPTGGVVIAALVKRRNNNSNPKPDSESISERVCDSRRLEITAKLEGMEKNLSLKIDNLQGDINEIKAKV